MTEAMLFELVSFTAETVVAVCVIGLLAIGIFAGRKG